MTKKISFIHAADLHLDSPFNGLAHMPETIFEDIQKSTFVALDNLVETAIELQVDFMLIVGDLFDQERQSLKAQMRLRRAFQQLSEHAIYVYLSHGNHDHIKGNIHSVKYPGNVFIYPSEKVSHFVFEKNGVSLAEIHGFSYENRAVLENKVASYEPVDPNIPFHIAMMHGSLQSNTTHDTYAPFLVSDLLEKDFDYWALGHIHQREILKKSPPIVYPGNLQGRHRKELGEKGCYHVVLSEGEPVVDFIPLQAIQFEKVSIDVSSCGELHQLETVIITTLKQRAIITPQLIDLTLVSNQSNLSAWKRKYDLDDIIELINETFMDQKIWQYIFKTSMNIKYSIHDQSKYEGDFFMGELSRQFKGSSIQPHIKELYRHKQGRRFLETLSEEEQGEIKKEAHQLLFQELLNGGGE